MVRPECTSWRTQAAHHVCKQLAVSNRELKLPARKMRWQICIAFRERERGDDFIPHCRIKSYQPTVASSYHRTNCVRYNIIMNYIMIHAPIVSLFYEFCVLLTCFWLRCRWTRRMSWLDLMIRSLWRGYWIRRLNMPGRQFWTPSALPASPTSHFVSIGHQLWKVFSWTFP